METFHIYQPIAKGKPKIDKVDIFMSFFTPGKENAIKRKKLVMLCVDAGLIKYHKNWDNMDRAMRKLLEIAKLDYSITNDGDGKGYYIPTKEEAARLDRNNSREDRKAISTFKGNKVNKALAEDYKHDRVGSG